MGRCEYGNPGSKGDGDVVVGHALDEASSRVVVPLLAAALAVGPLLASRFLGLVCALATDAARERRRSGTSSVAGRGQRGGWGSGPAATGRHATGASTD